METTHISVDQARILPRFRPGQPAPVTADRARLHHDQSDTLRETLASGLTTPRARSNDGIMVDPRDLRGIPIVGRHVGGTSPGTDPLQAAINHLTRTERSAT